MTDERQPPPSGGDDQQPAPDEPTQTPHRRRRLRGYLANGTDLSQRTAQLPPSVGPRDPGDAENRQDGPEAAGAGASPGGTA